MAATRDVVKRALLTPRNPVRSTRYRADRHRTHVWNNTEGTLGGPDVAFELLLERGFGPSRSPPECRTGPYTWFRGSTPSPGRTSSWCGGMGWRQASSPLLLGFRDGGHRQRQGLLSVGQPRSASPHSARVPEVSDHATLRRNGCHAVTRAVPDSVGLCRPPLAAAGLGLGLGLVVMASRGRVASRDDVRRSAFLRLTRVLEVSEHASLL